ncbi:MAG: amidohydrolase [Gemmatimonadota bacterium]|nr:amidohydrolase [Gemmatimonadota bacterium]
MRNTMTRLFLGSALMALAACGSPEPADLVLHNGKIVTVDADFSIQEAVAVRDGRIIEVGGNDLLARYDAGRVIDLGGRMVMPGFNDTHTHISGTPFRELDLTETTSIAQLQEQVRAKAEQLGEGEWVTGYGWAEDVFAEQRMPTRADLDAAAPRNPVTLTRAGGHSAVVNSLAFELAGITRTSPNPARGILEKDARGELNGIIRERQDTVGRLVPAATSEETRPSFVQTLRDQLELGITSLAQAGVSPRGFEEWETVYAEYGEELPRANVQIRWAGRERMEAFGRKTGDGNERIRVGAVKVFVDGGFTGPSAYTIDEYRSEPGFHGSLDIDPEELRTIVRDAHAMGWQMGFHAIGDAAIQLIVNDFVEVLQASPRANHRHYLNHFTVRPPPEVMDLMAEHDILITQQPNFTYTLEARYVDNLQEIHAAHNNPLRSPMDHGVFVALSSDILPIGPMVGLYAAVTRKGVSGAVYAPEERLTMEEAIIGYTRNGAYLTFEEDIKGTLEPGMLADMIVLSDDLLTIDPERIMDVEVETTILGGRVVFER